MTKHIYMTNNVEIKNNGNKSAAVELNDDNANFTLHHPIKPMDMDNMNINENTIALDSDGDEILEENAQKTVSFKDQETRISNLVSNAVSAKTSLQIKKEIMSSKKPKTTTMTYTTDKEEGFITVGKNNKPKLLHASSDRNEVTKDKKDVRANALANERKMDKGTETIKSKSKTVTPTKKSSLKVKHQPYRQSTNPYMRTTHQNTNRTPPKTLNDKKKERSERNAATIQEIKRSYLDVSAHTVRKEIENGSKVRVKFQFTPTYGANDPREILTNIFEHLKVFDQTAQILPWDEGDNNHSGPIRMSDLADVSSIAKSDLKAYVDVPKSSIREGYSQGQKIWNVQVHINTTIKNDKFKDIWSSKKRDIINKGVVFTSITRSCIQDSPKAFLIGIAQGSTEGMNEQLINSKLENVVGIQGIRVSYQTIHQPGITKQLWDNANRKAKATKAPHMSRDFLDKKYAWAPEGLGVYVNNIEIADLARKKMMSMYGTTNDQGIPPIWPGGECMRFVPLKDTYINSDKTRAKVDRRFKMHVFLKANERVIVTNFRNINGKLQDEMTLQEYVLGIHSTETPNIQLFRHFKKIWSKDPEDTVWVLSVHKSLLHEAEKVAMTLEDTLRDSFGDVMDEFISPSARQVRRRNAYRPTAHQKTNDDDWFDDEEEEKDILFQTGIIVEGYEDLFSEQGYESDHVSWDMTTRKSAETDFSGDIVDNRASPSSSTDVSPLTTSVTKEDIEHRTETVVGMLRATYKFKPNEILCVRQSINPFQIFGSMVAFPTFNALDTVRAICALRQSFKDDPYQDSKLPPTLQKLTPPPPPPDSDSEEDIYN